MALLLETSSMGVNRGVSPFYVLGMAPPTPEFRTTRRLIDILLERTSIHLARVGLALRERPRIWQGALQVQMNVMGIRRHTPLQVRWFQERIRLWLGTKHPKLTRIWSRPGLAEALGQSQ